MRPEVLLAVFEVIVVCTYCGGLEYGRHGGSMAWYDGGYGSGWCYGMVWWWVKYEK